MSDLSEKAKQVSSFMDSCANEKTIEARADSWLANVTANRPHFLTPNPPLLGLTAFVVAAGPSLRKNVKALKTIGRMGVIVCVDAAYRYLVEQGVTPDYCATIDADTRMVTMIEGVDTSKTTLVAQASASPALINAWRGPKYFLRATGGSRELDDKLHAAHRIVKAKRAMLPGEEIDPVADVEVVFAGLNDALACGGNVTSYAHVFALSLLRATKVVFVGADYAWLDDNDFYAGGAHQKLAAERMSGEQILSHSGLGGAENATNFTLFHLKSWHEEIASAHPGHCVNATEGGILGVGKKGNTLVGWEHLSLADAVAKYAPTCAREAVTA
ncbi:MAG: DUF115 domain-containing protein [Sphingomonadales bacterium]|nr:DUF115 domain-containing protein [Sphingomonadaceae bacterium]MBS3930420.1 DUF115 domain-containing protein [Sphingomonadales bacterium]